MTDFPLIPRTPASKLRYVLEQLGGVHAQDSAGQTRLIGAQMVLEQLAEELEAAPEFPLPIRPDGTHAYVSTYCVHGDHAACRRVCKSCPAECQCDCGHPAPSPSAVSRVAVTVTAPTPDDANRWARGVADLVRAEFGDSMRLDVLVAPAAPRSGIVVWHPPTPGAGTGEE
jgi:hypothetical protein